ncbi:hypothetical protein [Candidatus Odyssella acanthamoebae]|uniref:Uncharacterized protein n=1 Tax=Candidatus Odyssella acanthamoebae TaxID=91604 RepID=A0A077AU85_9PROT|nr:hypothetical protein [Candidatus Paracaedibacter acanthamoebae]AIK95579.1 hypothetical protein ID47_00605 [Candidatus Paracaedibacter acanthamoebae]
MSHNYTQYGSIPLVGDQNVSIPVVDPRIKHLNSVTTPEWMISIDKLLSSNIEGYETFTELYGWFAEQARLTKGSTASQLFSTSAVQHSNILIVIPNGLYLPMLETIMNTGSNLSAIKIVRLANITDLKIPIQEVDYTNCKVESIQQKLDEIILSIRPETRMNTVIQYAQDGSKLGQNVSFFDYVTGKAT